MFKDFEQSRWYGGVVMALFLLILFIATWRLPYSPVPWFDEGINLGIAKSLVEHGVYSLPVGPDEFVETRQFLITTNYPVLLPVAGSIAMFGNTITAARVPMVIFLFAFAALAFVFVQKLFGKLPALMTLALIASFVPFYGNGKNVLGEVPGLAYFLAGLSFLHRAESWKRLCAAGLMFGLSAATKPFFLLVLPVAALGELYRYWRTRTGFLKRLLFLALGAALPLIAWFITIVPSVSFDGILSIVGYYGNSYAASDFFGLIGQNLLRFFTETTPMHFTVLFVVSCVAYYAGWRKKETMHEVETMLWAFIIATALWYLKTPGWYRYFFPAHLLLFFLFPAALFRILPKRVAALLSVALFMFQFGFLISKRIDPLYYSSEVARVGDMVEGSPRAENILIVNSPSLAFFVDGQKNVYQFLQINPQLFFGRDSLSTKEGAPYDMIVVNGGLEGTALEGFGNILTRAYRVLRTEGHYTLYERL